MSEEIIRKIAILETKHEERWNQHDESARELKTDMRSGFEELKDSIDKIFSKINRLPCGVMEEKVKSLGHKVAWIWGITASIILAIVGIAMRGLFLR